MCVHVCSCVSAALHERRVKAKRRHPLRWIDIWQLTIELVNVNIVIGRSEGELYHSLGVAIG